jgi:hypothetical protein
MSLNIGDNFRYYGKKFLDDRQSFKTLNELLACTDVPEGFISYCEENKTRYEFEDNNWIEYRENGIPNDVIINEEDIMDAIIYVGDDEPEGDKLWLDPSNDSSSPEITLDNPIILELFACIKSLQEKVIKLEEEVEYLKINGGGGSGSGPLDPPDIPEVPDDDEEVEYEESILALEEGGLFLFEDGTFVLLEESVAKPLTDSILILEDGSRFLMEDGSYFVLEDSVPAIIDGAFLLENNASLLLENGGKLLIE